MRSLEEETWKDLQGKIVHLRVGPVYPNGPGVIAVSAEILETEQYFTFEIYVGKEKE